METLFALGRHTLAGLRALLVLTLLVGLAYPLAVTGVAQTAFDWRASGSLVTADGSRTTSYDDAVGSALIGQAFAGPQWFHPRPSVAGEGWDPLATAGSNLGPQNADLVATIQGRRASVAAEEGIDPADVPADALTASASGLDPHVSPAYAALQVPRVARENGLSEQQVRDLVEEHTDGRTLGVLGEARVDVLALNSAVAALRD
ncbi:potassium-transporting ATPase subunit KdpC [Nocardioides sp. P5_C9_2]